MVESDVERKKRLRKEKLEAWKRKKQKQQDSVPETANGLAQSSSKIEIRPTSSIKPSKDNRLGKMTSLKKGFQVIHGKGLARTVHGSIFETLAEGSNSIGDNSSSNFNAAISHASNSKAKISESSAETKNDSLDSFFSNLDTVQSKKAQNNRQVIDPDLDPADEFTTAGDANSDPLSLLSGLKSKKKNITVDHSKISYNPFIRNLYVESEEVSELTVEQVAALRSSLGGIKVIPKNAPNPIWRWAQLGLNSRWIDSLEEMGAQEPTAIQSQCIPSILKGRDVMAIAETGSGKSLGFLIPVIRHITHQSNRRKGPSALILAPTRELAVQTASVAAKLEPRINSVAVFGGENIAKQVAKLIKGVDLVVGTPGRVIDLVASKRLVLQDVTFVVVDEADRMFDMGFQPQIGAIIDAVRPDAQRALFSATFPLKLEKLAQKFLKYDPLQISVGIRGVNSDVKQVVEVMDDPSKFERLLEVIGSFSQKYSEFLGPSIDSSKVLIFVDRQDAADGLCMRLKNLGYTCASLHGGKSQNERETTIHNFSNDKIEILVATSIAARGLDVKKLGLVVNYEAPNHMEDYVHRAGRTGRAGSKGVVVTFVEPSQKREIYDIVKALKLSKVEVPASLQEISDRFSADVKTGKTKFFLGFGGKGLEKLDEQRESDKMKQKENALGDGESKAEDGKPAKSQISGAKTKEIQDTVSSISDFVVYEGKADSTTDSGMFHSTIHVSDLPQDVRWKTTNREAIKQIIDESGCSITSKGRFYKPNEKVGTEPKLYLLIEGDTKNQVSKALQLMKESFENSLKDYVESENRKGVTGRYTVT